MIEKTYYRRDRKLKNLKVPVRRRKKIIKAEVEEEGTTTGSIPNPATTVQGPKFGWINPLHKGRKNPTILTRGGLNRRFKQWYKDNDKV